MPTRFDSLSGRNTWRPSTSKTYGDWEPDQPWGRPTSSAALAPSVAAASAAASTAPTPVQQVRQPELAEAYQNQLSNIANAGQQALDDAVALSPKLNQVAEEAYQAGIEAQNLDRFRGAVDTAASARQSAVQKTLENLRSQADLGFQTAQRSLDAERVTSGLPTLGSSFYRNLGNAYYRNYLPVEAQALNIQTNNINQDFAAEQALKNAELAAAGQRAASAAGYANAVSQPVQLRLSALGQLGNALATTAPIADRAYFNYVQGNDGLPDLPIATPGYSVPPVYDPLQDVLNAAQFTNPAVNPGLDPAVQLASSAAQPVDTRPVYGPLTAAQTLAADRAMLPTRPTPLLPVSAADRVQQQLAGYDPTMLAIAQQSMFPDNFESLNPVRQLIALRDLENRGVL